MERHPWAVAAPDDRGLETEALHNYRPRTRENVWLEVRWFWGRLGTKRIMILRKGAIEISSDLQGLERCDYDKVPSEKGDNIRRFISSIHHSQRNAAMGDSDARRASTPPCMGGATTVLPTGGVAPHCRTKAVLTEKFISLLTPSSPTVIVNREFVPANGEGSRTAVYEVLALVAGVVIGLIAYRLVSTRLKSAMVIMGSVAIGAIVSFVSGELSVSWAYLGFDIAQVLIAAGVTMVLLTGWRHWSARLR